MHVMNWKPTSLSGWSYFQGNRRVRSGLGPDRLEIGLCVKKTAGVNPAIFDAGHDVKVEAG